MWWCMYRPIVLLVGRAAELALLHELYMTKRERVCVSVSRKPSNDTNKTATAPSQASRRTVRGRQQLGQALAGRAHERGAKAELLTVELLLTRLVLLLLLLLICQYTHGHQQYHHEQCKIREQRSTISMHCRSASERMDGRERRRRG